MVFSNHFITDFPQNVPVKNFWKSVYIFEEDIEKIAANFLAHPVHEDRNKHTTHSKLQIEYKVDLKISSIIWPVASWAAWLQLFSGE